MSSLSAEPVRGGEPSPLVSVLTPTWNRARYLERVWNGLAAQTYGNFEWIVCDDGSDDSTQQVLSELVGKSNFPVTVVVASHHIGKARMDNEAVGLAKGELILWNDSDDVLLGHALAALVDAWKSIPESAIHEFVGVTALCATKAGVISSSLPQAGSFDASWNDLREKFKVTGDMLYCTRADALKQNPFPEVDFVVPEGIVWTTIGYAKTRVCPIVLKVVEYEAEHSISFSRKMEYCRGRTYAIAKLEGNLRRYPKSIATRLWHLLTYQRCSIHGEIPREQALVLWEGNTPSALYYSLLPLAWLLAMKDRLQGKVRRTHRDFDIAARKVEISIASFRK